MKNSRKMFIIFRRILLVLLIFFLVNYFAVGSGYYESEMKKRTVLTEEKIEEFENDIKNNEYVDLKDYTTYEYVDTSSPFSSAGYFFSEGVSDFINNKLVNFFNVIGKLFG